jgi:hypothetical protein
MAIATSEADTQVLRKGKQVLLHLWHPLCYSSYKSGDMSDWMRKGQCKWNISVFIYDTYIPKDLTK